MQVNITHILWLALVLFKYSVQIWDSNASKGASPLYFHRMPNHLILSNDNRKNDQYQFQSIWDE